MGEQSEAVTQPLEGRTRDKYASLERVAYAG
jgi:hypothetical protein